MHERCDGRLHLRQVLPTIRAPSDKDAYEKAEDVCLEDGQWYQVRLSADNRDERGMIRGYGEI